MKYSENKEVFVKHEKAPTAPPPIQRGIDYLVYAHDLKSLLLGILANFRWPKLPKGTFSHQNISFGLSPTSIRPSVTKKQPGQANISKKGCFRKFRPDSANFR